MSAQHHYVSQFHLRQFVDPDSMSQRDPWVWRGTLPDGPVQRRAPKNVGTKRLMFDGRGGLADPDSTIESFLANEVEGPAAEALKQVCSRPPGAGGDIPPELTRYLAWAAARSLPMKSLFEIWSADHGNESMSIEEEPPDWLADASALDTPVAMVHPHHGERVFSDAHQAVAATQEGWMPDLRDRTNFLEVLHVQAAYFQTRFFPRLDWFFLGPPDGEFFVLADRAVGWIVDGQTDLSPAHLRLDRAVMVAPLSRGRLLVGKHGRDPWNPGPTTEQINAAIAGMADEWIVGPTHDVVFRAMQNRQELVD